MTCKPRCHVDGHCKHHKCPGLHVQHQMVSNASKTATACQGLPCLKDKYWIREVNPAVLCIIHQQTKSTNGRYQNLGLPKTKVVCAASEARTSSLQRAHTCMATDPCFAAVSGSLLPHLDYLQGHGHAKATQLFSILRCLFNSETSSLHWQSKLRNAWGQ